MGQVSFTVYIDESGDEGFLFRPDGSGSRRWLVLSAAVVRKKNDHTLVDLMRGIRGRLGRPRDRQLHFSKLKHEHRVPYVRDISSAPIRTVTVLIHKPAIHEPEKFQSEKYLLYRYATRYLLERVSWLCRDHGVKGDGDGSAEIIFSNRNMMSYEDLRSYLKLLRDQSDPMDVRIDWNVVSPDAVRAINHDQLAGLQIADAVASSFYFAAALNRYGETEERYARLLLPTCYRHKGNVLGYGLKFWPEDVEKMKSANPHLAWFAES